MIGLKDKETLVADLAALRRIEMNSAQPELGTVRARLARLIGPTISRAMAARALDVSQTAFDRRIESADVPVVMSPEGRREVPLATLVDLIVAVQQRRRDAPEDPHPFASVLHERRLDAEALDADHLLPSGYRRDAHGTGHRQAELRSLAYHRAVARRLDDRLLEDARQRLREWRADESIDERYTDRWERVLSRSLPAIRRFIGSDSQEARELRQSSPFAGALTELERRKILAVVG